MALLKTNNYFRQIGSEVHSYSTTVLLCTIVLPVFFPLPPQSFLLIESPAQKQTVFTETFDSSPHRGVFDQISWSDFQIPKQKICY